MVEEEGTKVSALDSKEKLHKDDLLLITDMEAPAPTTKKTTAQAFIDLNLAQATALAVALGF